MPANHPNLKIRNLCWQSLLLLEMAWFSILPDNLSVVETWAARVFVGCPEHSGALFSRFNELTMFARIDIPRHTYYRALGGAPCI